ncbi:MAG: DUF58 domain-containing protein [Petrotogaceae bacterium]|nr:DUF58 domain-containing protein [Petrotogaceae bacterium]
MRTDNVKIKKITVYITIFSFLALTELSLVLWFILAMLWISFFTKKTAFKKLEVSDSLEYERIFVDEDVCFTVSIKNHSNEEFTLFVTPPHLVDTFFPKEDLFVLGKQEIQKRKFTFSFSERGNKKIGRYTVSFEDRFGLFSFWKVYEVCTEIKVFPKLVAGIFRNQALKKLLPSQKSGVRILEDVSMFENISEYDNEPLNRIHWKASARYDKLMVKKFSFTSMGRTRIYLDANFPTQELILNQAWKELHYQYVEYAIQACGSLIKQMIENNQEVIFKVFSKNYETVDSKNWVEYFDVLSSLEGDYDPIQNFQFYLQEDLRFLTFEDTVIIVSMFLSESILPLLIDIRARCSKVIVLLMPYGFRLEDEEKTEYVERFRDELLTLQQKGEVLEENHVLVRLVSSNHSLLEVYESV